MIDAFPHHSLETTIRPIRNTVTSTSNPEQLIRGLFRPRPRDHASHLGYDYAVDRLYARSLALTGPWLVEAVRKQSRLQWSVPAISPHLRPQLQLWPRTMLGTRSERIPVAQNIRIAILQHTPILPNSPLHNPSADPSSSVGS